MQRRQGWYHAMPTGGGGGNGHSSDHVAELVQAVWIEELKPKLQQKVYEVSY